ncbi:MAG TPA: GNAT family N-acetyltransferase [Jatrophihabitantaceae bacterium]|nr:GNAT family N-acetyltransferase [Jatrophihabitantaceae bacterium]
MADVVVRDASIAEIDAAVLYRILRLRVDVFVVEQNCVYAELDGRDLEPTTRMVWAERDGEVLATLRILAEPSGARRIGRIATAGHARGGGLAARLISHALELIGDREAILHAQSHLTEWYEHFGFEVSGDDYIEDGIPHTPMRRVP